MSEIEIKTIILLANSGPLSGYDLHSKKKSDGSSEAAHTNIMSDVHWLNVRKNLLKYRLIIAMPIEGRKKPFKLSENGFDLILRGHLDEINRFDNFVEHHKEYFPLVFSYWEELKKYELDGYIKDNLKKMIENIYLDVIRDLTLKKIEKYSHEQFTDDLYASIYIPELYVDKGKDTGLIPVDKIVNFRARKPEIKRFVKNWIKEEKMKSYQKIKTMEQIEKSLHK